MDRADEVVGVIIDFIKEKEGFRGKAYKCPAGVWTVGYGDTEGVTSTSTCTEEQADARLHKQLVTRFSELMSMCPSLRELSVHKQAACLSLAYNIGNKAFHGSSVHRFIIAKRMDDAANAFLLWNKARVNGVLKALPGLTKRREAERQIFLRG